MIRTGIVSIMIAAAAFAAPATAETYRGITIAPEHRCAGVTVAHPTSPDDYHYPQSVEAQIVAELGGAIYGPYTGTHLPQHPRHGHRAHRRAVRSSRQWSVRGARQRQSRLCPRPAEPDPGASPPQPLPEDWEGCSGVDTPAVNACWFAARTLEVRRKYGLTIDRAEATAVEKILAGCPSTDMVQHPLRIQSAPPSAGCGCRSRMAWMP